MENFEEYIKKALYYGGFSTRKELAEWLEIDQSNISSWARDGIPKKHIKKIEKLFEESPSFGILKSTGFSIPLMLHPSSAGNGEQADCEIECMIEISKSVLCIQEDKLKNYIAVKIQGDSMRPTFDDKDTVILDTTSRGGSDGIYCLNINGSFFIKRLRYTPRNVKVISDNPQYQDSKVDDDWFEFNELNVVGRVVCAICRF
jgi:hypothetical protein